MHTRSIGDEPVPVLIIADDGHVTAVFPHPPRAFYPVAHEVIEQMVDDANELNQWRRHAAGLGPAPTGSGDAAAGSV